MFSYSSKACLNQDYKQLGCFKFVAAVVFIHYRENSEISATLCL